MTAPEPAGKTTGRPAALCEGVFRGRHPYGHAPATVRLSYRLAGEDRTRLRLLCDGCTEAARDALAGEGTVMITVRRL